ncbi:MAG: ribosomal-protein-alanine N-acetyltransferase [Bacteroidia bacterium]|jgi:ribosomal-protein-alanine N-acetyltransferase
MHHEVIISESDRIFLRPLALADGKDLFMLNANPNILQYTGDPPFTNEAAAVHFIKYYSDYQAYGMGRWVVVNKLSSKFLGWCGLKRHSDGSVDLGFRFFENEWNKGYATEASKLCIAYGFDSLKLTEIIGRAEKENTASIRVLKKLGFTFANELPVEGLRSPVTFILTKANYENQGNHIS